MLRGLELESIDSCNHELNCYPSRQNTQGLFWQDFQVDQMFEAE